MFEPTLNFPAHDKYASVTDKQIREDLFRWMRCNMGVVHNVLERLEVYPLMSEADKLKVLCIALGEQLVAAQNELMQHELNRPIL